MHFTVNKEHRRFFREKGYIEFENLLTEKELEDFRCGIDQVLMQRLKLSFEGMQRVRAPQAQLVSRDLWRDSVVLQKLICKRRFAEIAGELIAERPLRLAYDQLLLGDCWPTETSIIAGSAFQGIVCALIFCLEDMSDEDCQKSQFSILPIKAANAVYISSEYLLSFHANNHLLRRHLLVVYAQDKLSCILNNKDKHTHFLKKMGYVFGDLVNGTTHPVVYR